LASIPIHTLQSAHMVDDTPSNMSDTSGHAAIPRMTTQAAETLGDHCRARGWHISCAESCTGGGIGLLITSIAGSSDYFQGGVISYSNEVKQRLLNVSPETLASVGAVSEQCAHEMALGVRAAIGTEVGISSTGIAGPSGATGRKPVGLVYIAVATPETSQVRELRLQGDRATIMFQAALAAIDLANDILGADAPEKENATS
jgi:PncC family amidohydrolase